MSIGGRSLKRAFPSKVKSVAACELPTVAGIEQSKQTNHSSSKACSSAAMIGIAAISTTMGVSGILMPGESDQAIATELPKVGTKKNYSSEIKIPELNETGVNQPKGLLLHKLTQGTVSIAGNTDSGIDVIQPQTVLQSGQKQGDKSFSDIENQPEYSQQKVKTSPDQPLVFFEPKLNQLQPLGSLEEVKVKKAFSSNFQPVERLTTAIKPLQKPENTLPKSSTKLNNQEFLSESVGKSFDSSNNKFLEKTYQESGSLVVEEPELRRDGTQVDNNSTDTQVSYSAVNISQESINTKRAKLEGAVVIDSEMTSTPVSLVYKVRVGDTLGLIAKEHNISVKALAQINRIQDPDLIGTAQLLKVPQKPFSESLTLVSSKVGYSRNLESSFSEKHKFNQPSQETTSNQLDIPETKLSAITKKYDYSSSGIPNVNVPKSELTDSSKLVSWSQDLNHKQQQINQKIKRFSIPTHLVATDIPKTPLVNGKVWPNYLEFRGANIEQENQINSSNGQPIQPISVDRGTKDTELQPIAPTAPQENPYANRLRAEIIRLRQEYDAQKEQESQLTNSESITIPVPEPASSENILSGNSQNYTEHLNTSRYLQPTYQREINPQTRQSSEETRISQPQIRNPATVVKEPTLVGNIRESQESSIVAAAPIEANADEVLNNPSLGKMVSPNLPPLGRADTYLPGGSMQFTGYTWPTRGTLTSGYGWRWGRMHRGIDIAAPTGTPIVAAAPGVVTFADWSSGGYGNLVEIKHPNGSLTIYAHNSKILVREGQTVAQGELIAKMGSTGRSTGPHSHFEIHPTGKGAVNPMAYLPSRIASNN